MSAILGVIHTDCRATSFESVAPALPSMQHLGPDGQAIWCQGNAALVHFSLQTTVESAEEQWPMMGLDGCWLIADARIDNRNELIRLLGYPQADGSPTDGALILAAHAKWGDNAPAHLVGDFAYALWHPAGQRLQLVRSPFGLKSLYYSVANDRVMFATTLRGVVSLLTHPTPDLPWIASFLARRMDHLFEGSATEGVSKVPPAYLLTFTPSERAPRRKQFWELKPSDQYESWSDADWDEGFRETFEEAVLSSCHTSGPAALSVSGGFDSSAIAVVAHRLMHKESRLPSRPVFAYSLRMPGWTETDESDFRNAVIERLPSFRCDWVDVHHSWTWETVEQWQPDMSTPSAFPNAFMFRSLLEGARAEGCRVKISGAGGDAITGAEDYWNSRAFLSLSWRDRWHEAAHFSGKKGGYVGLARSALGLALPSAARNWWQEQRRATRLVTPQCEALARTDAPVFKPPPGLTGVQRYLWEVLNEPVYLQPFEQRAEIMALNGLELRCPFYDRRLVELAFNMPSHLRVWAGEPRVAARRALERDLPPLLLQRKSKADFTNFTAYSVTREAHTRASHLAPEALVNQQGWIDTSRWRQWTSRPTRPTQTGAVHRVAHLTQWLEGQATW